jgi:hypothetical protein
MGGAREHNGALQQQHHGGRRRSERSVVVVGNCGLGDGEGEKNMYRLWSAHLRHETVTFRGCCHRCLRHECGGGDARRGPVREELFGVEGVRA